VPEGTTDVVLRAVIDGSELVCGWYQLPSRTLVEWRVDLAGECSAISGLDVPYDNNTYHCGDQSGATCSASAT
jgi:hypothetical protein